MFFANLTLLDSTGAVVVKYIYDAWGNNAVVNGSGKIVTSGIGVLNPFRYRGYYYDTETELYYLQTRYYDPEIGRFISQDSLDYADPETINGLNLYAYCGNNPVMGYDPTGTIDWGKVWAAIMGIVSVISIVVGSVLVATGVGAAFGTLLIGAGIGGLIGMGGNAISQGIKNGWNNIDWGEVAIDGAAGFITGALFSSSLGAVATGISIGLVGFVHSVSTDLYKSKGNWDKVNWGKAVTLGVIDGTISGVGKYFVQSARFMSNFTNSLPWVKAASAVAANGGRASYLALWKLFMAGQLLYRNIIKLIASGVRSGINTLIKNLW